ncbi:endonuclease/exonuclease/phosphatase family protein [Caldimonas tepidiphila]|uniref:endonuclease/exonuclease/phosphatase family protein n=1 Tax=Caldimonas tepidiphila TaxID=2315841 RepID=UPI001F0BC00A|nr:endonuclease/exonuclease/phosphatase family protein [Caldimonas tepidiphila]
MNPLQSTSLPPADPAHEHRRLRVATYNIHKGVRGVGPAKRLEIHNLQLGIEALDADVVCLQEVRNFCHRDSRRFARTHFGWPDSPQAEYLAPDGYGVAYRTNCITRTGEHGNALLSRWPIGDIGHRDVSDHRFEQRGLLHVPVSWRDTTVHVVVAHFGLIHASRVRQVEKLSAFLRDHVPAGVPLVVAGDFNDWSEKLDGPMGAIGLARGGPRVLTFPSRVPVFGLDRVYLRGLRCVSSFVPRGPAWTRMSDHLPLVTELELAG